ncbi:YciI family protein [Jannaschia pohangensis]|uniref:YCII-related domain-containing protein n=1 Tax=Jannaschia pohangensis TaxID=390807 RepID=A0A1I3PY97_9RHOB|nr:YciI family protein [Jannaschia pohangensis]SFJ26844.1 hypothetical protein SAMN04488095_2358 [Jannaschia pohangensis]
MMHALICTDKPGHLEMRKANRDAHVAYLKSNAAVLQAGPFLNGQGEMCGSLIILDTEDRSQAEAFAASDPYALAGLFEDVRIEAWNRVINA